MDRCRGRGYKLIFEKVHLLSNVNKLMLAGILALLAIGVLFIYSACYISEDQPVRVLYLKQLLWIGVGLLLYTLIAMNDYREWAKYSWWFYAGSIVLLVAVLLFGTKMYGARRWLMIMGIHVQPAEFAKLAIVLLLARMMSRPEFDHNSFPAVLKILSLVAVPFLLILKQPDLGTALAFLPVTFFMMFGGGLRLKNMGILLMLGLIVASMTLGILFLPEKLGMSEERQMKVMGLTGLSDYHKKRILVFMSAESDPLGAGWNKMQSKIAVGSGGVTGKGFLRGTQNILGFLPKSVAPTDFIYSVIAEEKGFAGSVVVIVLFVLVITCGTLVAIETRDEFGRLICIGVMSLMFFHAFVNMAMTVGLLPITGLPLPLLSYGGSFTVVTLASLGFVQSVHIRSRRPVEY